MTNSPLISIVLPTYNGQKYLRQSIESCLRQTYQNLELIAVDDCSTDQTPEIVRSFDDARIRYVRNETNQRLPRSLNIGFAQARGEYLTWTSDDNFYKPDAVKKMFDFLQKQQADFVYADIISMVREDLSNTQIKNLPDSDQLKNKNCVMACFLYTRRVYEKTGDYDPDMELIEDYDYWVRVSKNFQLRHLAEPLYYYRYHEHSLCGTRYRDVRVAELLFKLKYGWLSPSEVSWYLRQKKAGGKRVLLNPFKFWQYWTLKRAVNQMLINYVQKGCSFTSTRKALADLLEKPQEGGKDFDLLLSVLHPGKKVNGT